MCKINSEYQKYVVKKGLKKVLYLILNQVLYRCVQSAFLWYKCLVDVLIDISFEVNSYDLCIADKTINGKQYTIIWHVDNIKILHEDINVVKDVILELKEKIGKMTVNFRPNYDFLRIKLRFLENRTLEVDIRKYLEDAVKDFSKDRLKLAKTPAKLDLFNVNNKLRRVEE